ncbi:hypothetical protein Q5692_33770 [Microcoleus sp. C2C3]
MGIGVAPIPHHAIEPLYAALIISVHATPTLVAGSCNVDDGLSF